MGIVDRLSKLKNLLSEKHIDAVLVSKRENFMYFSGFNGTSGYLLLSNKEKILLTDSRYLEQARNQAPDFRVIDYKNKLMETLKEVVDELGFKTIGIESKVVSYDDYTKYKKYNFVEEIVCLGNSLDMQRIVKDEEELKLIIEAVGLADRAFSNVLKFIKPGVAEVEVAAEIEYYLKRNGARGPSFDTIVASGKRSSLPHGIASEKKIELGDPIIIDFGAIYKDYCSDMTRTVFVGEPNEEMKKIYKIVQEAQNIAVTKVSKGMTCKEVDLLARGIIEKFGYGERFGHGLGHGVGLEIHEGPTLSPKLESILENNMVITVEPGIYVPELGGVRIEDMAIIHENSPRILTSSSKDLMIL